MIANEERLKRKRDEWLKGYRKTDKYKNRIRSYGDDNLAKSIVSRAKSRANKKGLEFNITENDIYVPTHCPALGISLFRGKGVSCPNSPTIDRIDSSKGYIKGNVQIISKRANCIKSDATIEEIKLVLKHLESLDPP